MHKAPEYWYGSKRGIKYYFLIPFSWIFCLLVSVRRLLYRIKVLPSQSLPTPVIVIGNITVGGNGKTPLVIQVAELLKENRYKPGLVSRGYGGKATQWPQRVEADSDPEMVGDEAVMLVSRTGCPMTVGPDRVAAARSLIQNDDVDVIISDDGLQHYAMRRDIEIVVVHGERRFGNGWCLPAGPLRERISRLSEADIIVANGSGKPHEYSMFISHCFAVNMQTGETRSLSEFTCLKIHAIAGIGHPGSFFNRLKKYQLDIIEHEFPDHYQYSQQDFEFGDEATVMMTEKDATKCMYFANQFFWYVPINVTLENSFNQRLLALLENTIENQTGQRSEEKIH